MYNMTYNTHHVGTAALRQASSGHGLEELVEEHAVVAVGPYAHEVSAYVLAPATMRELSEAAERWSRLRQVLPVLTAALRAGVAIPSATLAELGIELPDDSWQAINEFQATHDIPVTVDEDGNRLLPAALAHEPFVEFDDELEFVVD
jgi:hypothetical protein